jgi:arylsulfatase A-like enzyme
MRLDEKGSSMSKLNVLLVLADDMGFSDIGCYGGEIDTPNIDRLARGGVRFSQFYNTARCSPSRASLLTGLHPHQTGIGILIATTGREAQAPRRRRRLDREVGGVGRTGRRDCLGNDAGHLRQSRQDGARGRRLEVARFER